MFTRKIQNQIFDSIIRQSESVIQKELNERAKKLEDTYKSIRYNTTKMLITDAKVEVDDNMRVNISIKLNESIEFEDTERQNLPLVLERGGGLRVKGGNPAMIGGHYLRDILGVMV